MGHSCAVFNGNIIVAGGSTGRDGIKSTEIINLTSMNSRPARNGDLSKKREKFGLGVTKTGGFKTLYAIGGFVENYYGIQASMEIWNERSEKWEESSKSLQTRRTLFGIASVPKSLICDG